MPPDEETQNPSTSNAELGAETEDDIWVMDPADEAAEETPAEPAVEAAAEETPEEPVAEPVAEAPVEAKPEEDETLPPLDWKPAIQQNLYTDEEQQWLERAQDDPDPKIRLQAQQFMMNKTVEYNNRAALVAQAQMASIPQPFLAVHGPVVAEYLNTYVKPERRGAPEALEEAQAWAVMQRSKQIGPAKAYREAANLLDGIRPVVVQQQPAPAPKPTPQPKTPIPAEQKLPAGGAGVVTDRVVQTKRSGVARIGAALGIDME